MRRRSAFLRRKSSGAPEALSQPHLSSRTLPRLYERSGCQAAITGAIGSGGGLLAAAANGCHPRRRLITITKDVYRQDSHRRTNSWYPVPLLQAVPVLIFAFV